MVRAPDNLNSERSAQVTNGGVRPGVESVVRGGKKTLMPPCDTVWGVVIYDTAE